MGIRSCMYCGTDGNLSFNKDLKEYECKTCKEETKEMLDDYINSL